LLDPPPQLESRPMADVRISTARIRLVVRLSMERQARRRAGRARMRSPAIVMAPSPKRRNWSSEAFLNAEPGAVLVKLTVPVPVPFLGTVIGDVPTVQAGALTAPVGPLARCSC